MGGKRKRGRLVTAQFVTKKSAVAGQRWEELFPLSFREAAFSTVGVHLFLSIPAFVDGVLATVLQYYGPFKLYFYQWHEGDRDCSRNNCSTPEVLARLDAFFTPREALIARLASSTKDIDIGDDDCRPDLAAFLAIKGNSKRKEFLEKLSDQDLDFFREQMESYSELWCCAGKHEQYLQLHSVKMTE